MDQLREILWELDNTITASDMDQIIEEIDADDSGTVDFEGRRQGCGRLTGAGSQRGTCCGTEQALTSVAEFIAVMCGDD